jgi:DNA-binding MarR family transcriptional regulator
MTELVKNRESAAEGADVAAPSAFFISRISALNVLLKRRAAIYARRSFDIPMIEWRIITLLPTLQPISIRELAVQALTDAAQVSRGVAQLEAKGHVRRTRSAEDNREMLVSMTARGSRLSAEMCGASLLRSEQLLAGCSEREVESLNATLDTLIERARELVAGDLQEMGDGAAAPKEPEKARRKSKAAGRRKG